MSQVSHASPSNSNHQPPVERACERCGRAFSVPAALIARGKGRFCSKSCAARSKGRGVVLRVCPQCGETFEEKPKYRDARFCSRACASAARRGTPGANWKGGRYVGSGGYVVVRDRARGVCEYEHRLVMEAHLGRPLARNEVVHHINGDRVDNRIENLQLMTQPEHMRLHHARTRWARGFDCCTHCGKTDSPFKARGLCGRCYHHWQRGTLG